MSEMHLLKINKKFLHFLMIENVSLKVSMKFLKIKMKKDDIHSEGQLTDWEIYK